MAPEFPPSIVVFDLEYQDDRLIGTLEYVESPDFNHRFTVNWSALKAPEGYRAIGSGVAYVYDKAHSLQILPLKEQVVPASLGEGRFLWSEGLHTGLPGVMCILILPKGTTIVDPTPPPTGSKLFKDRIALFWMLRSSDDERFAIEWTVKEFRGDLAPELERINRSYLSARPNIARNIAVEDARLSRGSAAGTEATFPQPNSVFLVHGHDDGAVQSVARFVERLGITPVILHEQINQGMTVIEKFEEFAKRAGFAIVLMTPDDQGHAAASPRRKMFRARQNVILELGYFAAKLGRRRTFVLRKGNIELPSDLLGLVYEPLDGTDGWKLRLAQELRAAGFQVDLNRAIGP
jgi:predicted nucleotide-binding protein